MEARQLLYTVEEFERIADIPENSDRLLELINGEMVEKMPTEEHGMIVALIVRLILNFILANNIKGRVSTEARHRIPGDNQNARLPDVSYRSGTRPLVKQGSIDEMPDLAVEIKSPDDSLKDMRAKARYYLANGTKLVWLVEPQRRFIEVYTQIEENILFEDDLLDGNPVLPGFQVMVREIFQDTAEG